MHDKRIDVQQADRTEDILATFAEKDKHQQRYFQFYMSYCVINISVKVVHFKLYVYGLTVSSGVGG